MPNLFEYARGSVVGRSHRLCGKNNQDAYHCLHLPECSVTVVCDGCGSGQHSEVGAHIGARLVARAIATRALATEKQTNGCPDSLVASPTLGSFAETVLEQARREVLSRFRVLSRSMGEDMSSVINNYFLFTVVGVLVTRSAAVFFSLGDGVLFVNGQQISLGPFPDNAPPYLAYGLVPGNLHATDPRALCFQVHCQLPLDEVKSFLIGTDGVQDLVQAAERCLPGKSECAGPLNQFWKDDRYFSNTDMIRRRLAGIGRDVVAPNANGGLYREAGLLPDDTTLIVGRRRSAVEVRITEVPDENQ